MSIVGMLFGKIGRWIVSNKVKSIIIGSVAALAIGGSVAADSLMTSHEHSPLAAVKENSIAATCEENGSYDSVIYCGECDEEIERKTVTVNATGHKEVTDYPVNPTCTFPGLTRGKHCSVCNKVTVAQTILDALGHTEVTDSAVAPTCVATGLTEGTHCSVCFKTLKEQTVIPALDHNLETHSAQAPTCTKPGWDAYSACSRTGCTYTTYTERSALGHDLNEHEAQDPTCTKIGWNAYHTCNRCDYTTYEELEALGHRVLALIQEAQTLVNYTTTNDIASPFTISGNLITSTNKSNSSSSTYTITAKRSFVLELEYLVSSENNYDWLKITHNGSEKARVSGTSVTNYRQLSISMNDGDTVSITYSKDGSQSSGNDCAYVKILTKDVTTVEEIKALLPLTDAIVASNLSCTDDIICNACNTKIADKLGHDYVNHDAKAPTCTDIGWNAYQTCTRCTYTTYRESAALNHDYVEHDAKTPNCIEVGWYEYDTCSRCDYTTYEERPATVHVHTMASSRCTVCGIAESTSGLSYSSNSDGTYTVTGIDTCNESEIVIGAYNGKSVTAIKDNAFSGRTEITGITIESCVTDIGSSAFYGCTSLTRVSIGNGVTKIGNNAFKNCSTLAKIVIPSSVETIGERAFEYCVGITSVTVGSGVTSIGTDAFWGCCKLFEVSNKSSLEITAANPSHGYVGYYAAEVHSDDSKVVDLNGYLFYTFDDKNYLIGYAGNDTSLVLPENYNGGAYRISKYAFAERSKLTGVILPKNLLSIGEYAFNGCSKINSVSVPDSVTSIGRGAFSGCSSLKSITLPYVESNIGYIFGNLISGSDASTQQHYYIPTSLKSITVTGGDISDGAFYGCENIEKVILNGVKSIGEHAFYGCKMLESIDVYDTVTTVGADAFYGCERLTVYNMHAEKPNGWDASWNSSDCTVIWGCTGFGTTDDGLDWVSTANRVIIRKYIGDATSVIIPEKINDVNVTEIYSKAFYAKSTLTGITIPEGVKTIGSHAFYGCTALESIILPKGLVSIGESAFSGCSLVTTLVVPDSVTSIGLGAFSGFSSLTSITIPFVGGSAKADTDNGQYPFGYIFGTDSYTGGTMTEQYYYDDPARDPVIASYCIPTSLKTVNVTGGNILYGAFYGCKNITGITLPKNVTAIGDYAFYGCNKLSLVVIPNVITDIGISAFCNCTSLTTVKYRGNEAEWNSITKGKSWDDKAGAYTVIYTYTGTEQTYQFHANGADAINPIKGTDPITLPTPTRSGYRFMGWYTDVAFAGEPVNSTYYSSIELEQTLYAKWLSEEEYLLSMLDGSSYDKAYILKTGVPFEVTIDTAGEEIYFVFTATEKKNYTFFSSGIADTFGYLYDANKSLLLSNDDTDSESNFTITTELDKDATVYIKVKLYSTAPIGEFAVNVI